MGLSRVDAVRWLFAVAALYIAPRMALAWRPGRLSLTPEVGLLLVALFLASRLPHRRWFAWAAAVPWTLIGAYETARTVGRYATNDDLPLYDLVLLARHLFILGHDLYGGLATALLVAVVVSPLPLTGLGALLFGEVERAYRQVSPRLGAALVAVPLLIGVAWGALPRERWSAPALADNLEQSWALYRKVRSQLETRSHQDLEGIELRSKPDVLIYVIESYGRILATDPAYAPQWTPVVQELDQQLTEVGWSTASAWDTSPVHGGRSWIADQSLLLGLHVSHEAEYQHVITWTDRLPSLRKFFTEQGYTTVLVKPTDRARPGVPLENPYGFDRTVFNLDLDYHGPIVGWGQIPDQYSIERVQETVLDPIEEPRFAFFHLATAHLPWTPAPPMVEHWSEWQDMEGSRDPMFVARSVQSQLDMELTRFRRNAAPNKPKPRDVTDQRGDYLADVLYDLRCIARVLDDGPKRPALVLILGDHQPPLLAEDAGQDVPVHVLASDPALLEGLTEVGFEPGLLPTREHAAVAHEDLFDVIAKTLARADR